MGNEGKEYWQGAGISEGWQNFWLLGWTRGHQFGGVTCDAASIPIFGPNWEIKQIKFRLMDESKGRYRADPSGLGSYPFLCDPDADHTGHVIAVEGEKKAAVVFSHLGNGRVPVIGMPGLTPGSSTYDLLNGADKLTIIVDPGGREAAWKMCKAVGPEKCHVLVPTERMGKIDDWINKYHPSSDELRWIIKQGAKPAWR